MQNGIVLITLAYFTHFRDNSFQEPVNTYALKIITDYCFGDRKLHALEKVCYSDRHSLCDLVIFEHLRSWKSQISFDEKQNFRSRESTLHSQRKTGIICFYSAVTLPFNILNGIAKTNIYSSFRYFDLNWVVPQRKPSSSITYLGKPELWFLESNWPF